MKNFIEVQTVYTEQQKADYSEYCAMSNYYRRCLPATSYWRILNGQTPVKVPPTDENYKRYFDKKCYDIFESRKTDPRYKK